MFFYTEMIIFKQRLFVTNLFHILNEKLFFPHRWITTNIWNLNKFMYITHYCYCRCVQYYMIGRRNKTIILITNIIYSMIYDISLKCVKVLLNVLLFCLFFNHIRGLVPPKSKNRCNHDETPYNLEVMISEVSIDSLV